MMELVDFVLRVTGICCWVIVIVLLITSAFSSPTDNAKIIIDLLDKPGWSFEKDYIKNNNVCIKYEGDVEISDMKIPFNYQDRNHIVSKIRVVVESRTTKQLKELKWDSLYV